MSYLYKLVDERSMADAEKGIISFSRPFISFPGSEGKYIKFFNRLRRKYLEAKEKGTIQNLRPSETDEREMMEWWNAMKKYGCPDGESSPESDILLYLCINIGHLYCGYFTGENLDDPTTLENYRKKVGTGEKIGYIRIDEEFLNHLHWGSKDIDGQYKKCFDSKNDHDQFNGYMHIYDASYSYSYDNVEEIARLFNEKEQRPFAVWTNILNPEFSDQNEKRVRFVLQSLKKGGNELVVPCYYVSENGTTSQFTYMLDLFKYMEDGPDYISLDIGKENILCKRFVE